MFYYRRRQPLAIRQGAFKAHLRTKATVGDTKEYERDPSGNYDIAVKHPDVVAGIMKLRREHESKMIEGEDRLAPRNRSRNNT